MSLSKKQKTEDNFRRDSFSDRICNDLSELILQYLSLEDKLRVECVSKQFQRTVYQRQFELTVVKNDSFEKPFFLGNGISKLVSKSRFIDLILFESLLKRCHNLRTIEICGDYCSSTDSEQMIQMITKYCDHLIELDFPLSEISDQTFNDFEQKFGPKMKSMDGFRSFNLFPNIEEIYLSGKSSKAEMILNLNLSRVKKLKLKFNCNSEVLHVILQLGLNKCLKIRYLWIDLLGMLFNESLLNVFKDIPILNDLIEIKLQSNWLYEDEITDLFQVLVKKCPKLKNIELSVLIFTENILNLRQLLSPLKTLKELKRLDLSLLFYNSNALQNDIIFSLETFKDLSNITHLSLHIHGKQRLDETSFINIDINLPKLQYLKIWSQFKTYSEEGVTQMTDILSRLSILQTLMLQCDCCVDYQEIGLKVIEKRRKIKTMI